MHRSGYCTYGWDCVCDVLRNFDGCDDKAEKSSVPLVKVSGRRGNELRVSGNGDNQYDSDENNYYGGGAFYDCLS